MARDSLYLARPANRLIIENQWLNTQNIAGIVFNTFLPDGDFVLGFSSNKGTLKRSQLSPDEQAYGFSTNKMVRAKNFVFTGSISYQYKEQEDVGWTARMDPLTLNPYMLADSLLGVYKKDYISLGGGWGYLVSHRLSTGINVSYMVADGARIKDPRPQNKLFNLEVFPSFIYTFDKFKLGATLHLLKSREKISYTTLENSSTYRFFRMFGLGKGAKTINGWAYSRNYYSSGLGGELIAQYNLGSKKLLSGFEYFYQIEEVEDGSSNPKKLDGGDFKETRYKFYSIINYGERLIHSLTAGVDMLIGKGIEFIQEPYSEDGITYYRTIGESENYSTWQVLPSVNYKLAGPYNNFLNKWEVIFTAKADIFNAEYILEAEKSYTNITGGLEFNRFLYFKTGMLSLSASGAYHYNLSNGLKQLRAYTASQEIAVWDNIIEPDFILNTSNIYALGANIKYGRYLNLLENKRNMLYIDFGINYRSGNNAFWDKSKRFEKYCLKIGLSY